MTAALSRRTFVGAACVGCAGLVAGCGTSGEASTADLPTSAPLSSSPSVGASAAPPASGSAEALVALADLPVGSSKGATAPDGTKILITRTGDATVVAFDATCPHQGCTVAAAGSKLACPCHGSTFDPRTGAVTNGPAKKALGGFAVAVSAGSVVAA